MDCTCDRRKVEAAVSALAHDPRPHGSLKLSGADGYRVRVGNYRVVYTITDKVRVVTVINIGHRRDIYRED